MTWPSTAMIFYFVRAIVGGLEHTLLCDTLNPDTLAEVLF